MPAPSENSAARNLGAWPTMNDAVRAAVEHVPNLTSSIRRPDVPRGRDGDLHECTSTGEIWRLSNRRWVTVRRAVFGIIPSAPETRTAKLVMRCANGAGLVFLLEKQHAEPEPVPWHFSAVGGAVECCYGFHAAAVTLRHAAIQVVRAGGLVVSATGLPSEFATLINQDGAMLRPERLPTAFMRQMLVERLGSNGNAVGEIRDGTSEYVAAMEREMQRVAPGIVSDIMDATILAMASTMPTQQAAAPNPARSSGYEAQISAKPPVEPIKAADYWRRKA